MIAVAAFDLETTGTDVESDRIVTAAVVVLDGAGEVLAEREWLINPGIPIPAEATAVHGITDEQAAAGLDPADALTDLTACLLFPLSRGYPLVAYNAPFDLTMLDREHRRHLGDPSPVPTTLVLDPLVIDKGIDRYRKGKRTLTAAAEHYGITFDGDAHGARADALAAARLAQVIQQHEKLAQYGPAALHRAQIDWAEQQADSFADYLRRQGEHARADTIDGSWPLIPFGSCPECHASEAAHRFDCSRRS